MSYVRFSHDSDFYIYYSCDDMFHIHVCGARYNYKTCTHEPIRRPEAGASFMVKTLDEVVAEIRRLRKLGYRIPRGAFDAIKRDQRRAQS